MESLPLVPLQTVMLPGVDVPLQVFESRYRRLVADLTREGFPSERFGIVGIRRGREVGDGSPELFEVGTGAVLTNAVDTGPAIAVAASTRGRFRLEEVHTDRAPYLVGSVTWLDEDEPPTPRRIIDRASASFLEFLEVLGGHPYTGGASANALTSWIVDEIDLPWFEKQAVLEAGDASARLRAAARLARRETGLARTLRCRPASVAAAGDLNPN